jgi:hypothetical protein
MDLDRQSRSSASPNPAAGVVLTRVLALLLLCAVPVLSTLAKGSAYLPQSNTTHFINIAAKIKVADVPVVVSQPQIAEHLAAVAIPQPEIRVVRQDELEAPPITKVSLTVCLQHRSPPHTHS